MVEKGGEVGAHILSGAVMEPRALNELIPDWPDGARRSTRRQRDDRFLFLTETRSFRLPTPPQMHNHGNYIVSLGNVCRWLASQAEELGVEIYPGFAAAELLEEDGRIIGIATGDMGIGKDGKPTGNFQRGMELRATLHAVRRRLPRLARQAADGAVQSARRARPADLRHRHQGAVGGSRSQPPARPGRTHDRLAAGQRAPMADRSSIISGKTWFHMASLSAWITAIPGCRRSTRCSASRPIPRCAGTSRAGGGSPMARGR